MLGRVDTARVADRAHFEYVKAAALHISATRLACCVGALGLGALACTSVQDYHHRAAAGCRCAADNCLQVKQCKLKTTFIRVSAAGVNHCKCWHVFAGLKAH